MTITVYTDHQEDCWPDINTRTLFRQSCKLSCCNSCSYCARVFPKERIKSLVASLSCSNRLQIKICERCFLCDSIVLCKACNKCQKCCLKSACKGQTSKLLANLAGSGCRSEGSSNLERGLHPPLSDPAQSHKVSHSHKLLWQFSQEPLPVRGITSAYRQKRGRVGSKSKISGVFQPTFLDVQTQQQVETHPRPEQTKSFPQGAKIQNGDTGNHQNLSPTGRMGHLHRFQGCLFPHTDTGTVQGISKISRGGSDIPVQGSALWSVHSTLGVHCGSK